MVKSVRLMGLAILIAVGLSVFLFACGDDDNLKKEIASTEKDIETLEEMQAIAKKFNDDSVEVRITAAVRLQEIITLGNNGKNRGNVEVVRFAVFTLTDVLNDESPKVRSAIVVALGNIGNLMENPAATAVADEILSALERALKDENEAVRKEAEESLRRTRLHLDFLSQQ